MDEQILSKVNISSHSTYPVSHWNRATEHWSSLAQMVFHKAVRSILEKASHPPGLADVKMGLAKNVYLAKTNSILFHSCSLYCHNREFAVLALKVQTACQAAAWCQSLTWKNIGIDYSRHKQLILEIFMYIIIIIIGYPQCFHWSTSFYTSLKYSCHSKEGWSP